ncbi:MAG: hypothetical protein WCK86_17015 [Planctomycetia bacterium]
MWRWFIRSRLTACWNGAWLAWVGASLTCQSNDGLVSFAVVAGRQIFWRDAHAKTEIALIVTEGRMLARVVARC